MLLPNNAEAWLRVCLHNQGATQQEVSYTFSGSKAMAVSACSKYGYFL